MTENNEATRKSSGISERRSEGITGPSREVSKRDENMPLPETRLENEELEWAKRHIPDEPIPKKVERKTEIIEWDAGVKKKQSVPSTAEERLRKRIRSFKDQQERIQKDMFQNLKSLQQRIENIEERVAELKEQGQS